MTAAILWQLSAALTPLRHRFQFVVLMDALRAHLTTHVLDVFSSCRMLPCIVPSGMTDNMQPLDTHVFSPFKNALRERYAVARGRYPNGDAPMAAFIQSLREAMEDVIMRRRWQFAFCHNGFGLQQTHISHSLLTTLGLDAPVHITSDRPTLSQIELCLGRGAHVAAAVMWRRFIQPPELAATRVASSPIGSAHVAISANSTRPIFGRTRSQTRALRSDLSTQRCVCVLFPVGTRQNLYFLQVGGCEHSRHMQDLWFF